MICGAHDHWVKDCPDADKDESKTPSKKEKNQSKKSTNLLVLPADILDNHDLSDISDLRGDEAPRQVAVGDSVLLASSSLKDDDIVLDSGGSTSIFKNASLGTTEPYISDDSVSIGGAVDGGGAIETSTKMETQFGSVHYSEDCVANILSYSQVKDSAYSCYQRPDEDVFRVQMTHDSPEYMFERKLGIYVLSASSKARQEEVYVTTVEDTKKAFTKYEVERADRARELLSRLGYPSTAKAIQMLNSGGIINCDITSSDLLRAEKIYGPPNASLQGKTVKNTATPNKDEEPVIGLYKKQSVKR